jgi:hypothetical protein
MALMRTAKGLTEDHPIVVGDDNGDPPIQVVSTALVAGIRKGVTRWVTGSEVAKWIDNGGFIPIIRDDADAESPTSDDDAVRTSGGDGSVVEGSSEDPDSDVHDDGDDGEDDADGDDDPDPDMPAKSASKGDWEDYAALHGVDTEGWTKQDIVDHFA